jgi:hypothetical protein
MTAKFKLIIALLLIGGLFGFAGTASSYSGSNNYSCPAPGGAHFESAAPCLDYFNFSYQSVYDYPGFGYFDSEFEHHFTDPYSSGG